MKRIPLYISTLLLTATYTGCSQQEDWFNETTSNREQVLLSAGIASEITSAQTRATEGNEIAFATSNTEMKLYASATWNGHGVANTAYANTVIKVVKAGVSDGVESTSEGHNHKHNPLTYTTGSDWLYWDDFGAGDLSACTETGNFSTTPIATEGLTIYGIAVDGAAIPTRYASLEYTDLTKVLDEIPVIQNTGINKQDVVISNNVRKVGTETSGDNRHKYIVGASATNTKELVFKHIYNKITLNFKAGDGFVNDKGEAIPLDTALSVTLPNYNIKGLLDVTTGNFTFGKDKDDAAITSTGTITLLERLTTPSKIDDTNSYDQTYQALTLPGRAFTADGTDEAITFNFSGNTYKVTSAEVYAALNKNGEATDYATMKSGVHYIFNIKVNKTDVKLTATIQDWTTVNADLTPSNGTKADFSGLSTQFSDEFGLYLATTTSDKATNSDASSKTGYANPVIFEWKARTENAEAHYDYKDQSKIIYWPNNSTYYHFRAVANGTMTTDKDNGDYVTLTTKQTTTKPAQAGGEATTDAYADVIWGAPYTKAEGNNPSTISPALGPTSNEIHLSFYHKMAEVNFIIQTTEGNDKVDLATAPELVLNCVSTGKVKMQDGTVSASTTDTDLKDYTLAVTSSTTTKFENFGVVPQSTVNRTLKITTADGNVYEIKDLSQVKVTKEGATDADKITAWKEGTKYTYTITLKKSEITITAQVKDWDKVEADETIQIQ